MEIELNVKFLLSFLCQLMFWSSWHYLHAFLWTKHACLAWLGQAQCGIPRACLVHSPKHSLKFFRIQTVYGLCAVRTRLVRNSLAAYHHFDVDMKWYGEMRRVSIYISLSLSFLMAIFVHVSAAHVLASVPAQPSFRCRARFQCVQVCAG